MYVLVHLHVSNRFGDCRNNQKINLNLLCKCECKEKTEGSDFTLTVNSWGGGGGVRGRWINSTVHVVAALTSTTHQGVFTRELTEFIVGKKRLMVDLFASLITFMKIKGYRKIVFIKFETLAPNRSRRFFLQFPSIAPNCGKKHFVL